jgi:uncharacterized protein (DUF58 family)
MRIVREALYFKPNGTGTDIKTAIEYLSRVTTRKTVTFLISDFYDDDYKQALAIANKRHDIIAVSITDPAEIELPEVGVVLFTDAESGRQVAVDTSSAECARQYKARALERIDTRQKLFQSINVDSIDIRTDTPYARTLFSFFRMRGRRAR